MERKRQEPTLGRSDPGDLEFRPRRRHDWHSQGSPHATNDSLQFWSRAIILAVVAIVVAMGLIEWNARRQIAALERAMTMTPQQKASFDAEIRRSALEEAKVLEEVRRHVLSEPQNVWPSVEPLRSGQRCIQGRRFERIEGGWRDLPKSPC